MWERGQIGQDHLPIEVEEVVAEVEEVVVIIMATKQSFYASYVERKDILWQNV